MTELRKYNIKHEWIFNLDSLYDSLILIRYDIDDGEIDFPVNAYGIELKEWNDLQNLIEEVSHLDYISKSRKVTSKEYGRIKDLAYRRAQGRYIKCLNAGLSENDAGQELASF